MMRRAAILFAALLAGCAPAPVGTVPPDGLDAIERELAADIAVLASDDFGGRRPGTEGEAKTLSYLARQWQAAGLESGTNDPANAWFEPVALQLHTPDHSVAQFFRGSRPIVLPEGSVRVYTSGRRSLLERSPAVFVGREGASLDQSELAGRVAIMLWDHSRRIEQREALLEKGAAAVLAIIPDQGEFAEMIELRRKGSYRLEGEESGAALDGVISGEGAAALVGETSLAALTAAASGEDFRPVPLDLEGRFDATSLSSEVRTHNLIARLPGARPDAGAVVLLAHWDHFGTCAEGEGASAICNGAVDNASGLAVVSAVARRLAQGPQLDRDVYFLATTAEEWGLLGARAFTSDPPLPLDAIVAAFNVDTIAVAPRGGPVALVGNGMTALDPEVERIVGRLGREIGDPEYANRYVRRQDGWALLRHDIPTLMVSSAFADRDALEAFMRDRYHRTGDVAGAIELGGAAEDVLLHVALVRHFASVESHPAAAR